MKVVILATNWQKKEIEEKTTSSNATIIFITSILEIENLESYDALFLLTDNLPEGSFKEYSGKPIIINAAIDTLSNKKLPFNYSRIVAWPGFLKRSTWELATNDKDAVDIIFKGMEWKIIFVKDEPGLVAARIISMIVNEAYFTFGEKVSTQDEIDLAMKLGTNYPAGPFEWKDLIGIQNIYGLLNKLSETDKRYLAAPLLEEEYKNYILSQKN